jgi:hypothetical protein
MTTLGKIIIGVVLIGGVGLGGYMVTSFMKEDVSVMEREQQAQVNSVPQNGMSESATTTETEKTSVVTDKDMSFVDFVKKSGSYICNVTQNVSGVATKGEVYISDGNIRGDFTTQAQGMTISAHMIMKEGYTYTWNDMMPTSGFKVKVTESGKGTSTTKTQGTYSWNQASVGEYSCEAGSVTASKFEVPSTVTFTTITP